MKRFSICAALALTLLSSQGCSALDLIDQDRDYPASVFVASVGAVAVAAPTIVACAPLTLPLAAASKSGLERLVIVLAPGLIPGAPVFASVFFPLAPIEYTLRGAAGLLTYPPYDDEPIPFPVEEMRPSRPLVVSNELPASVEGLDSGTLVKGLAQEYLQDKTDGEVDEESTGYLARSVPKALIKALSDPRPKARLRAVEALGKLKRDDPEILRALEKATRDSDEKVRKAALSVLKELKTPLSQRKP